MADTGGDESPRGAFDPSGSLRGRETGRLPERNCRRYRDHVVLVVQAAGRLVGLADLAGIHKTPFQVIYENGIISEINPMIFFRIVLHRCRVGPDLGMRDMP